MPKDIAQDAQRTADHLASDISNNHPSLNRIIDEVDAQKRALTPTQFREFLNDLNKDTARLLPGLTIEGTMRQNGQSDLVIKDQTGGESFLDRNDGKQLQWLAKNHPTVLQKADGTKVTTHADGTREEYKDLGHGAYTFVRTGSPDGDNEVVHNYANGRQVIQKQDGSRTDSTTHRDGSFEEQSSGPRAKDNYRSQRTADGHLTIRYSDGSMVEAYHGQTKRSH